MCMPFYRAKLLVFAVVSWLVILKITNLLSIVINAMHMNVYLAHSQHVYAVGVFANPLSVRLIVSVCIYA